MADEAAHETKWVSVSPAEAERHPLYGIGGWLTVVAIGLLVMPVRAAVELMPLFDLGTDIQLPEPFASVLSVQIAENAILGLWSWGNVALLLLRLPGFVISFIAMLIVAALASLADLVIVPAIIAPYDTVVASEQAVYPDIWIAALRGVASAAIFVPYALLSDRVNVTFKNRVKPGDLTYLTELR